MTASNNQLSRFLKIEPSAVRSQHELTPAHRCLRALFFRMQSKPGLRSDCSVGIVEAKRAKCFTWSYSGEGVQDIDFKTFSMNSAAINKVPAPCQIPVETGHPRMDKIVPALPLRVWGPSWSRPLQRAKSLQWCPTLCDPIDSSPPGSPIPGIFQARVLEWGAIAFSGSHPLGFAKSLSRVSSSCPLKAQGKWNRTGPHGPCPHPTTSSACLLSVESFSRISLFREVRNVKTKESKL